ncbi:MAG: uracil-DNA glycosylase family protein [Hydrogenophilales bacterium]|nr:uracil-DNA glycosylase family protein [Hydrogenophilales bacterium]
MTRLGTLLTEIRACRLCEPHLPLGPKPVLRVSASARVLIVGQAPGRRVHETGIPWNDPSGDRLRIWLGMTREQFYDERHIAIVPAGLCYPGSGPRGDAPPRPECAPLWHPPLRALMPRIRLTLLIGQYAQAYYLGAQRKKSLRETVQAYRDYLPDYLPLPHPSPRNQLWLKQNPWFEDEVAPILKTRVAAALA